MLPNRRTTQMAGRANAPRAGFIAALALALALPGCGSGPTVLVHREPATSASSSKAPGWTPSARLTVAVLPFARPDDPLEPDYGRVKKGGAEELRMRLERGLVARPEFTVVDRAHVDRILEMQGAQASAVFDESRSQELGKLLAADAALFGKVDRYAVVPSTVGGHRARLDIAEVEFTVTLVELATGRILWKARHRGTARRSLPLPREEFDIDYANSRVIETKLYSKAMLADLGRLADLLVKETLETL